MVNRDIHIPLIALDGEQVFLRVLHIAVKCRQAVTVAVAAHSDIALTYCCKGFGDAVITAVLVLQGGAVVGGIDLGVVGRFSVNIGFVTYPHTGADAHGTVLCVGGVFQVTEAQSLCF
ncbi:hypothetical protein GMA8713_05210 [Grimontia marina]|uniref:Uncharacterized protein n=1 Tax=Grimontia marina TaxID=646534 RepID=A0A128FK28_9GAMM|nr:hypothetical protein GMA8713_05210 [Grimontia marina]